MKSAIQNTLQKLELKSAIQNTWQKSELKSAIQNTWQKIRTEISYTDYLAEIRTEISYTEYLAEIRNQNARSRNALVALEFALLAWPYRNRSWPYGLLKGVFFGCGGRREERQVCRLPERGVREDGQPHCLLAEHRLRARRPEHRQHVHSRRDH
jgi:hypothetical protein